MRSGRQGSQAGGKLKPLVHWSSPCLLGWIEQRLVGRNLLARLSRKAVALSKYSVLRRTGTGILRVLERVDDQADILSGVVRASASAQRTSWWCHWSGASAIQNGDAFLAHVDIVRVVRIADAFG